ncbi:MAG: hypothetical protein JO307_05225 [Bryobacterales bacterium]|nr:hypothetical protein [Bryobacterales bacterium]MBV9397966.1 hypothetical protein [Bryobacterales bacterium]
MAGRLFLSAAVVLMMLAPVFGADISGTWTASFDTQVGVQNYTYTFRVEGTKLTGTAKSENGTVQISEGTVTGDDVAFVENLDFQGMPLRIVYKGKVSGDQIKFTRTILDMITEELVAKRGK